MRFMMLMYPGPKAETGAMPDEMIELRQVFEMSDFDVSPGLAAEAEAIGQKLAKK